MPETIDYIHLAPRDGSGYQQCFVKGRNLRAETLFRATIGPEPMTPDEVARTMTCRLRRSGKPFTTAFAMRRCSRGNARRTGPRARPAA